MTTASSHAPSSFRPRHDAPRQPIEKLFDKLPPHAEEAEQALLGCMMLDPRVIGDVLQIIHSEDDFYQRSHAALYKVLVEMYDKGHAIDLVQVKQRLRDLNLFDEVGGMEFLLRLPEQVASPVGAAHYARVVADKAVLRRLIDAAGGILYDAYHTSESIDNVLSQAEQEIFRLASRTMTSEASKLKELLEETYQRLEEQEGRILTGLDTGFFELNEMLSGLQRGEMVIVAARPSMGKTAFALNLAEHIAANSHQPVVFFSLEMSKQQLAQRLLCSRSGVDAQKLRRNMLSADDFAHLHETCAQLADAPLFVDDTPGLTLLQMRAKGRRLAAKHDIQAVFVDYLQLMSNPGSNSRQEEVSELSRGIKAMARELNVPVICLSQLNRSPEAREGHRPRMSDLRESGSIEQDADVVLMLHREAYYHRGEDDDYETDNTAEIIIAKQRNGPTGTVKLVWNGATTRFNNLSHTSAPGSGEGY